MQEKRYGRQTPTVGFTLPYQTSRGKEAVDLYELSGRKAFEWQQNLIYDVLATDEAGQWVHSRCGFSVPRQNGKNEVIAMREDFGLHNGERILHTAHRTATSRAAWERLTAIIEASGIHEIKGECTSGYRSGKSKGQEWIEFDAEHGGGRVWFRTRSTTGGLGETFDCLIIDEAQEYQADQESALKYTIVSSPNPQTIYLGTPPTPYSSGTLFPRFRQDVLTGNKTHAMWAEWSVADQVPQNDVESWYETNPSLGYTLTERAIEDELGGDSVDFQIQRLGLWIKYNQKSAISKAEWQRLEVATLPKLVGALCIGVKFAKDGASVSVSIACKTDDEKTFVECIGNKPMRDGVEWIVTFLRHINGNYSKVIVDGANGFEMLSNAMKDARLKPPYAPTVREYIDGNAAFEQGVFSKTLVHMQQPAVEQIVSNCEKRAIGTAGGFGFKSTSLDYDISIMDSIVLAAWGATAFRPARKQKISY